MREAEIWRLRVPQVATMQSLVFEVEVQADRHGIECPGIERDQVRPGLDRKAPLQVSGRLLLASSPWHVSSFLMMILNSMIEVGLAVVCVEGHQGLALGL